MTRSVDKGRNWANMLGRLVLGTCLALALSPFSTAGVAMGQERDLADFEAYPLRRARAYDLDVDLREALADWGDEVEVVVDERRNRILVRGPAEAQDIAEALIRKAEKNAPRSRSGDKADTTNNSDKSNETAEEEEIEPRRESRSTERRRAKKTEDAAPLEIVSAPLARVSKDDLVERMTTLWGRRLSALATTNDDLTSFVVQNTDGPPLEIHINERDREVILRGPAPLAKEGAQLIRALDAGGSAKQKTRVAPLRASSRAYVQQAIQAVSSTGGASKTRRTPPGAAQLISRVFQDRRGEEESEPESTERVESPPDENARSNRTDETERGAPEVEPKEPPAKEEPESDASDALSGPVEIQQVEGLDAIIITGSERDVERVMKIIEEIERLTVETIPVIELYRMKNVDAETMADVLEPLYDDEFAPREGQVNITALVHPDALLLVGRAESVKAVIDLVERLDQPVDPPSQFEVFPLKHATASNASATLKSAFGDLGRFSSNLRIIPDGRTNSLIIQGGTRDLTAAKLLIEKIDAPASAVENELRVFELKFANAVDLAATLNSATEPVGGSSGGQGQQQPGQPEQNQGPGGFRGGRQQQGNQGQGQGGQDGQNQNQQQQQTTAAQAGQEPKSLLLKFLTVDQDGKTRTQTGSLGDIRVTPDTRRNALLVSAPPDAMELIAALIAEFDRPQAATAEIKVFTLLNGDATNMLTTLEDLFQISATNANNNQQGGGPEPQVSTDEGELAATLRFSLDTRTNSIIASGSASDLVVVEAILLSLDSRNVRERKTDVIKLKNAPALDVALAINDYLTRERQTQQATPNLVSAFERIEREVSVVPEIVTNSLIVSATPRFYDEIVRIVEQLDARAAMVMIQVLIAEVTLNNTDEFGVEVGLQDSLLFDRSLLSGFQLINSSSTQAVPGGGTITANTQTIVGANSTPGFDFNNNLLPGAVSTTGTATGVAGLILPNSGSTTALSTASQVGTQGLANFGLGRVNGDLGFGGLVLSASSNTVNLLLRALRERRRLEVLSRPQITTLDNQPAFIQVGQRVPFVGSSTVGVVGQTTGVNLQSVGLIVAVTPRITPDGLVVMEIDAEKSQVGPQSEALAVGFGQGGQVIRQPRIDITQAQTTISALDGQTVVFGGLITTSNQSVQRRVPGLSEIPLLGRFFRYDYQSGRKTELLIIMTPHIIRNQADADLVKITEAARMSWCLADVQKIHGDGGLRNRGDAWSDSETPTIYPDMDPAGLNPQGAEPIDAPAAEDTSWAPAGGRGRQGDRFQDRGFEREGRLRQRDLPPRSAAPYADRRDQTIENAVEPADYDPNLDRQPVERAYYDPPPSDDNAWRK